MGPTRLGWQDQCVVPSVGRSGRAAGEDVVLAQAALGHACGRCVGPGVCRAVYPTILEVSFICLLVLLSSARLADM